MKRRLFYLVVAHFLLFNGSAKAQWEQVNGPAGGNVYAITETSTDLIVGTRGGVYISSDNGSSWVSSSNGLTSLYVWTLATYGPDIYAGMYGGGGVCVSSNNGLLWQELNNGLTQPNVRSLIFAGSNLYAGTNGGGVFLSVSGTGWTVFNNGLTSFNVGALAVMGTYLIAGTFGGGVFLANNGSDWIKANSGLTDLKIRAMAVSGTNLFVATNDSGVFMSTNLGADWLEVNAGLTNRSVWSLTAKGTNIFAGTNGSGVFLSTNNGLSWTNISLGLTQLKVLSLYISNDGYVYAGTEESLWRRRVVQVLSIGNNNERITEGYFLEQNFPNPFNTSTTISWQLPKKAQVILKVYDFTGREVKTLMDENQAKGEHKIKFDATGLPAGVYFYKLQANGKVETKKMIVSR